MLQFTKIDVLFYSVLKAPIQADVAELVDALDLGSSISDVRVRVSPSAFNKSKRAIA